MSMRVLCLFVASAVLAQPLEWEQSEAYAKPIAASYTPSDILDKMKTPNQPYYSTCEAADGNIALEESSGIGTEWACAVTNNHQSKKYLVRVKTTRPDGLGKDRDHDFYYVVEPQQRIVANDGTGNFGPKGVSRCRLCGAVEYTGGDITKFRNLEPFGKGFQCRRECSATLYKHRNFNMYSRTITSDDRDLTDLEGISALKVGGKGCKLIAFNDVGFKNTDGSTQPICEFAAGDQDTAYDQRAVRQACYHKTKCPNGHDCIKSVKIYPTKRCSPGNAAQPPKCTFKGKPCIKPKLNSITILADQMGVAAKQNRVEVLERLFKAMAQVLDE